MEFSSREIIDATPEQVFAVLMDIEAVERLAGRRGIDLRRTTPHQSPAPGMGWQAAFSFRGRKRTSDITLSQIVPPSALVFDSTTGGLDTRFEIELTPLPEARTQVVATTRMMPKTLSARLLVQSMVLAKGTIARKYEVRMSQYAREVEERARRAM